MVAKIKSVGNVVWIVAVVIWNLFLCVLILGSCLPEKSEAETQSSNIVQTKTALPITPKQNSTSTLSPTPTKTPVPTISLLLCKDTYNLIGSSVKCEIPVAYCSYQPATSGSPTFCNDAPYPNHNFALVVWGSDWSDLDGHCIIVSGDVKFFGGKPQVEVFDRSQVDYCD